MFSVSLGWRLFLLKAQSGLICMGSLKKTPPQKVHVFFSFFLNIYFSSVQITSKDYFKNSHERIVQHFIFSK